MIGATFALLMASTVYSSNNVVFDGVGPYERRKRTQLLAGAAAIPGAAGEAGEALVMQFSVNNRRAET